MKQVSVAAALALAAWAGPAAALVSAPEVDLQTRQPQVRAGETARLEWHSQGTERCEASGAWHGTFGPHGSRTVGPLEGSATFNLTCSGPEGSSLAMVSVAVVGEVDLNWSRPAADAGGADAPDVAGYRIYYGKRPGDYEGVKEVTDPDVTARSLELPVGSYYIAITAVDASGHESPRSEPVQTRVQ